MQRFDAKQTLWSRRAAVCDHRSTELQLRYTRTMGVLLLWYTQKMGGGEACEARSMQEHGAQVT